MKSEKDKFTWELPNNKHAWAFYYFCKRQGDVVTIIQQDEETMTFSIEGDKRAGGGGIDRIEEGTYPARFVQIIDLGEQEETDFQTQKPTGKWSRKINFTYELPTERITVNDEDKPRWTGEMLKFSMHEKAKLPKRLNAIGKGKEKTIEDMLGNPCMIEIGSTTSGKAKVLNVSKPMKGMAIGELENDPKAFDMDAADLGVFDSLPDFLKEMIQNARNFRGSDIEQKLIQRGDDVEGDDGDDDDAPFDDDLPFDDD